MSAHFSFYRNVWKYSYYVGSINSFNLEFIQNVPETNVQLHRSVQEQKMNHLSGVISVDCISPVLIHEAYLNFISDETNPGGC